MYIESDYSDSVSSSSLSHHQKYTYHTLLSWLLSRDLKNNAIHHVRLLSPDPGSPQERLIAAVDWPVLTLVHRSMSEVGVRAGKCTLNTPCSTKSGGYRVAPLYTHQTKENRHPSRRNTNTALVASKLLQIRRVTRHCWVQTEKGSRVGRRAKQVNQPIS